MIRFTPISLSVITIEGTLSNIEFKEKELIDKLIPNADVVFIGCNFGEKKYDLYDPPKPKRNNRGRKTKERPHTRRQIQGSGTYMNSQITFFTKSDSVPDKIYKIKVFRNGEMQIPGIINEDLIDIKRAISKVGALMSTTLHVTSTLIDESVNIIMHNLLCRTYLFPYL